MINDTLAATCPNCHAIVNRHYFDCFGCHKCEDNETTNQEDTEKK